MASGYSNVENQKISEQEKLLHFLNELPWELDIENQKDLEKIEGYVQKSAKGFETDIVIDFAQTLHEATINAGNYKSGLSAVQELYDAFREQFSTNQHHKLLIYIGEFYNLLRNYEKTVDLMDEILPYIEDDSRLAAAYATKGSAEYRLGRNEVAVELYLKAIPLFRQENEAWKAAEMYNRLGMVYYSLEDSETAIMYFQRNIDLEEELQDPERLANGYINIGAAYNQAGEFEKALDFYHIGAEKAEQAGRVPEIARVTMNIANIYSELEQFDEALHFYHRSLEISKEIGLEYGILINQYNIGNLYFDQQQYEESEEAFLAAYQLMNRENHKYELRRLSEQLSELYITTSRFEEAVPFLQNYIEINSEIFDSEKLQITEDLRTAYETELKEQELLLAESTIKEQAMQNRFLMLLAVAFAIAFIAGVSYYRKRNEHLKQLYNRNLEVVKSLGIDDEKVRKSNNKQPGKADNPDHLDELYQKIKPLVIQEKIYTNPDLNLAKLSEMAGSNRKYVSEAITNATDMNFNNFINFYRINEAKKLILKGEENMSEVQYKCGFNSRTTFYTAFKKFTGMSPTQPSSKK